MRPENSKGDFFFFFTYSTKFHLHWSIILSDLKSQNPKSGLYIYVPTSRKRNNFTLIYTSYVGNFYTWVENLESIKFMSHQHNSTLIQTICNSIYISDFRTLKGFSIFFTGLEKNWRSWGLIYGPISTNWFQTFISSLVSHIWTSHGIPIYSTQINFQFILLFKHLNDTCNL